MAPYQSLVPSPILDSPIFAMDGEGIMSTENEPKFEVIPIQKEITDLLNRILDQNSEIIRLNTQIMQIFGQPYPVLRHYNPDDLRSMKFGDWVVKK